ncbi:MAG TPA: DUF1573 domain-containing protein [Gemmataceae bacterium]|nr:DUF1573 domain-containing protein [Gemmataceae bacterium]
MTPVLLLAAVLGADPAPLAIDLPAVDCGELPANKPLVRLFRLKNAGPTALTITDVTGACGCFRHSLAARELAPGESTELTVGINLLTQPEGPNTWRVAVRYKTDASPPTTGEQLVRLTAKVKKDVSVEPVALLLSAEREISGTFTVIDRRGKPLTVTGVRLGLKGVRAEVKPTADAGGRRIQKVELTVGEECPTGQHADEVCIDTDDPEYKELRVPLRVIRKAPATGVQVAPGSVTLRFAKDQATASSLVRLKDADDREVVVEKAESDHPAIACKWAAGPGAMATVRVTVDLEKAMAAGVGVVTVRIKGPAAETVLIPVSWTLP